MCSWFDVHASVQGINRHSHVGADHTSLKQRWWLGCAIYICGAGSQRNKAQWCHTLVPPHYLGQTRGKSAVCRGAHGQARCARGTRAQPEQGKAEATSVKQRREACTNPKLPPLSTKHANNTLIRDGNTKPCRFCLLHSSAKAMAQTRAVLS